MKKNRMSMDKLVSHFGGNRTMAYVAIVLFLIGLLIFIINSAILLSSPERAYRTLRIILKAGTDVAWVAAAILGTKYYPTKRNSILIWTLVWYTLGDIAVMFSYPTFALAAIILFVVFLDDLKLIIIASIYAVIVTSTMALSLSNRFFWLAGIVFALSDITGLLRISLSNNKYTYFVTTTIYFAAFLMLCISVYSTNRKEVVTIYDLFRMLSDSKSKKVSFWVCGKWALGLIKGDKHFSYDHIELAYDVDHVDEFLAWIKHARFEGKHRYAGGARDYYSEKYGELQVFPCLFETDGSAVLTTMNGTQLQLDEGYFEDVRVLGKTIPCIAPGGPELIRDVL